MNSVARALKLDDVETEYMFRLAGETLTQDARPATEDDIPQPYLTLLERLDPLPAMITNYRFDILAWNHGFCVLFPYFEDLPAKERNSMLMIFDDRARSLYQNWEEHAIQTVALFRTMNAERLVQPEYSELIEVLEQRNAYFCHLWEQMNLKSASPSVRTVDHPVIGPTRLGYVKLYLPDVDATLVIHQSEADERVDNHLRSLVEERRRSAMTADGQDPL
jgi:PAS domain-containing protein